MSGSRSRLIVAVFALLALSVPAHATCPTFTTLQNNTTADANQVMGNFNYILQCPNFTGEVGIGTSSPVAPLDIVSSSSMFLELAPNNSTTNTPLDFVTLGFQGITGAINVALRIGYPYGNGVNAGNKYDLIKAYAGNTILATDSAGNALGAVGIGTTSPAYILDVAGQARFTGGYTTSDRRWKTDIRPLASGLSTVMALRPVTYNWRRSEFPDMHFTEGRQIGFIAQDVEKVLPEIVSTDNKGFKSVSYENVVPVLTAAVQEQQVMNEHETAKLDTSIKTLAAANSRQATEIDTLKRENAELLAKMATIADRLASVEARLTRPEGRRQKRHLALSTPE